MPTKKTDAGREYKVDGKRFTWHPLDDDGKTGTLPDVVIPMRIKLRLIRKMAGREVDAAAAFEMLEALVPNQTETLDEMDVNDFMECFSTWQDEYNALNGVSQGE